MPPPSPDSRLTRLIPIVLALAIVAAAVVLGLIIAYGMRANPRQSSAGEIPAHGSLHTAPCAVHGPSEESDHG